MLLIAKQHFFFRELAVAIYIYFLEYLIEISFLLVLGQVTRNEGQGCLFQLGGPTEIAEVVQGALLYLVVYFCFRVVDNPVMLQCLLSTYPLLRLKLQQLVNQVNGLRRDVPPLIIVGPELALLHVPYDVLVGVAIERRVPTQQQVQDHANAPEVALLIV